MEKIANQLTELGSFIPQHLERNPKISTSTVGWQIDHSLRVINNVVKVMASSDPSQYKSSFNWRKKVIFFLKKIPRGKVRVPQNLMMPDVFNEEDLNDAWQLATQNLALLNNLHLDCYFEHPFFGQVHVRETFTFFVIHTEHHLKIIRDMLK